MVQLKPSTRQDARKKMHLCPKEMFIIWMGLKGECYLKESNFIFFIYIYMYILLNLNIQGEKLPEMQKYTRVVCDLKKVDVAFTHWIRIGLFALPNSWQDSRLQQCIAHTWFKQKVLKIDVTSWNYILDVLLFINLMQQFVKRHHPVPTATKITKIVW